ncbi:hypothetical protein OOT00_15945 [Desulfobotulus sp. H1]|uniref:Uncharacterized protein n=1 Tax=Desulfobotulus pelophilus TaxID=2823377 RepID=A0ABT3NDC1_9BACT|nr:hypothetical protein [Desulfobotulus pelophilus]MCW7755467.1 hypothetical protein [Desulfobotulus pelophilus]
MEKSIVAGYSGNLRFVSSLVVRLAMGLPVFVPVATAFVFRLA